MLPPTKSFPLLEFPDEDDEHEERELGGASARMFEFVSCGAPTTILFETVCRTKPSATPYVADGGEVQLTAIVSGTDPMSRGPGPGHVGDEQIVPPSQRKSFDALSSEPFLWATLGYATVPDD